jgi:hypothetical protein
MPNNHHPLSTPAIPFHHLFFLLPGERCVEVGESLVPHKMVHLCSENPVFVGASTTEKEGAVALARHLAAATIISLVVSTADVGVHFEIPVPHTHQVLLASAFLHAFLQEPMLQKAYEGGHASAGTNLHIASNKHKT